MSGAFVHLHVHSEYSIHDGLLRVKPLAQRVAELGMPAVALTDAHNLFGVVKFYKAARSLGVKAIIGMELNLVGAERESSTDRIVLLAQNACGYRCLARLSTRAFREGRRAGQVAVDRAWIEADSDGLLALSGGCRGDIGRLLLDGKTKPARRRLDWWRTIFGDRFYLQVERTGRAGEEAYLERVLDLASVSATPIVASNDVRFLKRDEFEAHEARVCIQQGYTLSDPKRPRHYSEQQYLRSAEEMAELFSDLPEALENSLEIARRCSLEIGLGTYSLPEFPVPEQVSRDEFFVNEAMQGLERRLDQLFDRHDPGFAGERRRYDERLAIELGVICQMGFAGYFLIVADFIRWAKQHAIPVGPGRGSGAGSLVAYALDITDLDPLAYDLLFERFLNPERVSMPDFDIDFCMEGRDRVIEYVAGKYGRDKVSQIATHGTMAAKAVVRDVGRIMGHPYGFVDRIAKLIPFEIGMTLDKALTQEQDLARAYQSEDEVRVIIDMGRALEGLARNVGKHAGGVVIAPTDLTDFTPLYCEEGSTALVSQLDKDDVEAIGLVKFDFLGLRTLTIIDWAVQTINVERAAKGQQSLDLTKIPLADPDTFKLLQEYRTTAVFQLESRGMKDLIKRLQPDCFEDIVALVALFRPGPLQSGMVDDFIDRKHGRARVEYPHPDLEAVLKPTYGVILYQEQVMQIAQVLASYTLGGADLLRRAMGKKKPEEMAKQRTIFVEGAAARGVDVDTASSIFDLMEKFAGYGFNKSHSAAYALVSYQTAWLKTHNPDAFMAAVLSADMDNTDKVMILIEECRSMRLRVVPPSINHSQYRFTVGTDHEVIYGLGAIKGVGEAAIESLLETRESGGEYSDLYALCRRVDLRKINRRVLEALIRAGALDCLGASRAGLMAELPDALKAAEQHSRDQSSGQADLFGIVAVSETSPNEHGGSSVAHPEWDDGQRLAAEKETLGLYLTGHPIDRFVPELERYTSGRLGKVLGSIERGNGYTRSERAVVIAGLVIEVRARLNQKGERIAFVTLDDRTARTDVRVFSEVYEKCRALLVSDTILVIEGKLSYDEYTERMRLSADHIMDLDQARERFSRRLVVSITAEDLAKGIAGGLAKCLEPYRNGGCPVVLDYAGERARAELLCDEGWKVRPAGPLLDALRHLVGGESVRLEY